MNTYVIPDLHGRADLLDAALDRIFAAAPGGTIVALGDYVDKGPDSNGVIERLLAGLPQNWRLFPLKGNHDAMMVNALRDPAAMAEWLPKGGDAALASYGGDAAAIPLAHLQWLEGLPLLHVDAHRVYVHAGLDPALPLDRQSDIVLLCKRYPKEAGDGYGTRHIVHGHDNVAGGPLLYRGRSNLDTRAWQTGRLVIGVFDDEQPGGPADLLVVNGRPLAA